MKKPIPIQIQKLLPAIIAIGCITAIFSCKKTSNPVTTVQQTLYNINGAHIQKSSTPIQLLGANTFHVFGSGGSDMNAWNLDIAREFIGNVKETPLAGNTIKDANGAWLYSLQNIVDSNRANNRISILCAFGWDGTGNTLFTGARPTQTSWWTDFKSRLLQWAIQFKDQPDVWLEVWNEPYRYDRTDGYSDDIWLSDMNELFALIRHAGNNNIVLIPCAEQGQDESVLLNKGAAFLDGKTNVLFDIHAYEKWLLDTDINIGQRLTNLQKQHLPVLIGEIAPMNAGALMNPQSMLNTAYSQGISVCAWAWKMQSSDQDALLTETGLPNNANNNNWGTMYKNFAAQIRKP